MDYNVIIDVATKSLIVSGTIALVVSLLVEFVIKPLYKNPKKEVLNIIVTILSIAFTFIVFAVYCDVTKLVVKWYYLFGTLVLGCITAGISMNGYDKISSYVYAWIKSMFGKED